jgi:hypothetical protein
MPWFLLVKHPWYWEKELFPGLVGGALFLVPWFSLRFLTSASFLFLLYFLDLLNFWSFLLLKGLSEGPSELPKSISADLKFGTILWYEIWYGLREKCPV